MVSSFIHGVELVELASGPRPVRTVRSSVIGIVGTAPDADATAFPIDTPVMVTTRGEAAKLDTLGTSQGTLPDAIDRIFDQHGAVVVVVRVTDDADPAVTRTNIIGGTDSSTGAYTGVHALLSAQGTLGVTPKILCAPGFTSHVTRDAGQVITAAPVTDELLKIAPKLRAIAVADGPDTTDSDAQVYASLFDDARLYLIDPHILVYDAAAATTSVQPASGAVAGVIARTDAEKGFWYSPSNQVIRGIAGTTRPIEYVPDDPNTRANLLNDGNIATIISLNGYRLWGNRVPTTDTKWAFLVARRIADMINQSLLEAHLWAVDRAITATYIEEVLESVNAYLRTMKAREAILGGQAWADPDLNTPTNLAAGKVYFDFDFTPPPPAERVVFRSRLVNDYLEEVFA